MSNVEVGISVEAGMVQVPSCQEEAQRRSGGLRTAHKGEGMSKHSKAGRQISGRMKRESKLRFKNFKKRAKAENKSMLEVMQEEKQ